MNFLDFVWHVSNFAAPALLLGAISSGVVKLLWRGQLRDWTWMQLCGSAVAASLAVCITGLIVTGRDGRMVTYAGMVFACAASLWWRTRRP
ncbi:MAG: hypothetical protein Q7T97_02220 [Burkholderiaceae bacterium]|nr:hypothetical protein [Burkholderiaceae bacterium]